MWVAGLVLLIIYPVTFLHLVGENFDWTEYLLLGTLFPALLIALSLLDRFRPTLSRATLNIKMGLAAFLLLLPPFALRHTKFKYVLIIALAQSLITSRYFSPTGRPHAEEEEEEEEEVADGAAKFFRAVVILFVSAMAWVSASRFIWWMPPEEFILASNFSFIIFVISFLLVILNLYDYAPRREDKESATSDDSRRSGLVGNVMAVLLIAMASVRTDKIFGLAEIHHWMFFTGPAHLVRQGGWLLWDVPSQYGFLSILTLAWLPTKTAWQSLFVVNALFNFLTALMIFYLFRALRPGFVNLCFALAMTLVAVFLRAGLAPYYLGPNHLPNIGGLRFFWCFALGAILFCEYRRARAGVLSRSILWAGCVVWLVGVLWSFESAFYCSFTWLPPFVLLVLRRGRMPPAPEQEEAEAAALSFKNRLLESARWLLLPPALFLSSLLVIAAIYFIRLGHGPDWRAYTEYASAYRGGFSALPIALHGAVWVLIVVFCAFMTTAAYFLRDERRRAALPLILGAGGLLWATSSYFVSRSHPNNIQNLSMVFCGVAGLMLYLLTRERGNGWWSVLVRAGLVPVLTVVLAGAFAHRGSLMDYLFAEQLSFAQIEKLIPISDPEIDALLNSAGVKPDDPMIYIGPDVILVFSGWTYMGEGERKEVLTTYRAWLPAIPVYSLSPLRDERRELFMTRFAARTHMSGWLIEHKNKEPVFPWFSEYLKLHYTPTRTFENDNWKLTWYDYKG